MSYGTFTLTGHHTTPSGKPHAGSVVITPNTIIRDTAGDIVLSGAEQVKLDADGVWSIILPCDSPGLNPASGIGYTIGYALRSTSMPQPSFYATADLAGSTLDVSEIVTVSVPAPLSAIVGPAGPSTPEATADTAGKVRLSGDLAGTANAPTVPALASKVETTDPRLSDARTPLAHAHPTSQVTGLDAALAGKAATDDPRLSDARTPLAHAHSTSQVTGLDSTLGNKVDTTDPRLSDARAPLAHSHTSAAITDFDAATATAVGPDTGSATDVKLRGNFSRVYTPEKYGAVGDGVADDTAAVVACFNAANAKARAGVVASIIHPGALVELKGTYNLATLSAPVEVRCNVRGHSAAFLIPAAYAGVAVRVGDERASGNYLQSARIELPDIVKPTGSPLIAGSVGCRIVNIGNSELSFGRILYIETGQHYTGWGQGAVYLKVFPGYMAFVKTAFKIMPDKAGGWANQIAFIAGSVQQSSGFAGGIRQTGWEHVHIDGNGINNVDEIHFIGTSFEGDVSENAIFVARARNITFTGCRHEQGTAGVGVTFTNGSPNVTWTGHGLAVGDMVAFTASTNPTGIFTSSPYYVIAVPDANTITVGQNKAGTAVTPTGAGTSTFGWRPPRVKFDSSNTLINVQIEHPYTILGVLEVVDTSDNGSGNSIQYAERRSVDSYQPDDLPLFRGRNRAAGATSRPVFAAYPTTVRPMENPRGWTAALADRGLLFAASGAEEARLYSSGGVLSWQRAGQAVAQVATSQRSPGLLAVTALSCAANVTTMIDFALANTAVNDHLNVTVVGPLPTGIIFSHAWVVSAGNIRVAFTNVTAGAISVTQNLQAISFSRFF